MSLNLMPLSTIALISSSEAWPNLIQLRSALPPLTALVWLHLAAYRVPMDKSPQLSATNMNRPGNLHRRPCRQYASQAAHPPVRVQCAQVHSASRRWQSRSDSLSLRVPSHSGRDWPLSCRRSSIRLKLLMSVVSLVPLAAAMPSRVLASGSYFRTPGGYSKARGKRRSGSILH